MQTKHVHLGLLPGSAGHHGPALVVDVEHELGGLLLAVAEQLLEHVGDVGHQVDRVVPDDDDPRAVHLHDIVDVGPVDPGGRWRGHAAIVHSRDATVNRPRSNRRAAIHTAVAPAMWMPTSSTGN